MHQPRSMVGSPLEADLDAFPKFRHASGHYATLQAAASAPGCFEFQTVSDCLRSQAGDLLYLRLGRIEL